MRQLRICAPSLVSVLLILLALSTRAAALGETNETCEALRYATDKCAFVRSHCQDDRLGFFDYLQVYYCASSSVASSFFLLGVILWLCILFMTIGVAASDYLCPNLNTISKMLKMSESLAGVTILALGNGSPDVFSTYAAMKIGSGSLAIGELVGAASFITAVVTGAMALIQPFKVARKSFMRDTIFFIIAVAFSMYVVSDGILQTWECVAMLVLYVVYVVFVVAWHWYNSRKRHSYLVETRARDVYTEPGHEASIEADEEITDNPSLLTQGFNFGDLDAAASFEDERPARDTYHTLGRAPAWQHDMDEEQEQEEAYNELTRVMTLRRFQQRSPNTQQNQQASSNLARSRSSAPIRTSLFGAMEFRNVLEQLEHARASAGHNIPLQTTTQNHEPLAYTDSPSPPPERQTIPDLIVTSEQSEPDSPAEYSSVMDYERAVSPGFEAYSDEPGHILDTHDAAEFLSSPQRLIFPSTEGASILKKHLAQLFNGWSPVITTLCPSLAGISEKSWLNQLICLITAPSIFMLSVTIPVIEADAIEKEDPVVPEQTNHIHLLAPVKTKVYIPITRWLIIIQATLGPAFVLFSGFADGETSIVALTLYSITISAILLLLIFFLIPESSRAPLYMQTLSFIGFVIALSWVSLVSNEVVGILKTLGHIFHISDAVLGLTVFAIGNSLGDLIANMTVAKMGFPMMALSACFGGPMLNILVGVGVSGMVVMPDKNGFPIQLSNTLLISGVTLLATLLFLLVSVPLNNWKLSRTLGAATILFWVIATIINVVIDIAT